MIGAPLVVGGGRILRGIVLWAILAIVLLLPVSLLLFLSVASEWNAEEALLRWRRVLVGITLLLVMRGVDKGHIGPCDPPSPMHSVSEENHKYDRETSDCDGDACSSAQSFPTDDIIETSWRGQFRPGRRDRGTSGLTHCSSSKSQPLRPKIARIR